MRLEAITTCINYGDFLTISARHNRGLLDRWIVVTSDKDKETREVCRKWNIDILLTEDGDRDGEFSKGRLIHRAQRLLAADSWRLHLDADIVLPTTFRNSLDTAELDQSKIYGADRVMVKSYQKWLDLYNSGYLSHQWDYHCRVIFPLGVEVGSRWVAPTLGYCPIGFFQLWHSKSDENVSHQHRAYAERHGEASRTDTQHPLLWDRRKRELLPEVIVVHLESERSEMGKNWNGRKTKRFESDKSAKKECPPIPYR